MARGWTCPGGEPSIAATSLSRVTKLERGRVTVQRSCKKWDNLLPRRQPSRHSHISRLGSRSSECRPAYRSLPRFCALAGACARQRHDVPYRASSRYPGRYRDHPAQAVGEAAPWPDRAIATVRRHWLVSALLAAGLVLRLLSQIAYQPAIIYVDTLKYLYGASPGADPLGYRWLLKAILSAGDLGAVALVQHLLGLAMAVALYLVLQRRGVSRWLASLAVAPVLLDAYQVQIEEMIMPDVWFEALLVAGLVVLLWRTTVSPWFAVTAGLIFAVSAIFHQLGEILALPAVVYLLACRGGWRRAVGTSAALAAAFALPILAYCTVSQVTTGHFWLARGQGVIGRMAAAADCATLRLPAEVRLLCPDPAAQAQGPDWLEHSAASPLFAPVLPAGTTISQRYALISQLSTAVEHQQPLRVVGSYLEDSVRLFGATRQDTFGVAPISRWQFQAQFPTYPQWVTLGPRNVIMIGLQRVSFGTFHYYRLSR